MKELRSGHGYLINLNPVAVSEAQWVRCPCVTVGVVSHTGDLRCCEAGIEAHVGLWMGLWECWVRHCSLTVCVWVCVCMHWFGLRDQPPSWLDPQAETAAAASIKLRWKMPYSKIAGLEWLAKRNPCPNTSWLPLVLKKSSCINGRIPV